MRNRSRWPSTDKRRGPLAQKRSMKLVAALAGCRLEGGLVEITTPGAAPALPEVRQEAAVQVRGGVSWWRASNLSLAGA